MNRVLLYRSSVVLALSLSLTACASGPLGPRGPRAPAPVVSKPKPAPPRGVMAPVPNRGGAGATAPRPAPPQRPAGQASPPRPTPPRPATDPARAAQLRAQGLEQLNRGAVDRAISLLRQAAQLDPSNARIKRDLDRAVRIGAAVKRK